MIRAIILTVTLILTIGVSSGAESRQPNVVLILTDDLGWGDLGCYGSDFYRTPNLDRLAAQGVRFTGAYAAAPVCSPSRASLLTGKSPARLHLTDWLPGRADRSDQKMARPVIHQQLPLEEETLAKLLKKAGYTTAHVGKWHLGGEGFGPKEQGFDVNNAGDQTGTPRSYFHPFKNNDGAMPGLESGASGEYLTDRLTREAEGFIEENKTKPFFLFLSHYAVHIPLRAREEMIAKYRAAHPGQKHTNAIYAAMIESVDESVGRIMRKLEALKLAEDTLVIFTSDNGGLSVREGANTPATSNAPLRAGKGYLYEGGIRVPLIVRWPGKAQSGLVRHDPVVGTDLFPTILAAAGIAVPEAGKQDGVDLSPVLTRQGMLSREMIAWHYPHYSNQGGKPGGAMREGNLKLIESYENGYLELYDLSDDVEEIQNIAGKFPDKANALQKKLETWRRSVDAQAMTLNPDYVIVPIQPSEDGSILLHSKDVTIHGVNVRYEPPAHKNTVGYWTRVDDWVSWDFEITKAGDYALEVLQGCGKGSGGSEVEFSVGDQVIKMIVEDTGHFQNFINRNIGKYSFAQPGKYTLAVKPKTKPGVAVMDIRQAVLRPLN